MDAIERRLAELTHRPSTSADGVPAEQTEAAIRSALAGVERQINRSGREQLKVSALLETQVEQIDNALEALRAADGRREAELEAVREQSRAASSDSLLDIVRALLPVLDGIDEALRSGRLMVDRSKSPLRHHASLPRLPGRTPQAQHDLVTLREAASSWLVGITIVRQRLLDVLATQGVQPIEAQGQPFDPERHIAVEVVPAGDDLPEGTVAAEVRRGYLTGDRILRHAEVAVGREEIAASSR